MRFVCCSKPYNNPTLDSFGDQRLKQRMSCNPSDSAGRSAHFFKAHNISPSCVLFQQLGAALPLPSRGQGGCHLSSLHAGNTQYIHLRCSRSETQVCSQVMTLSPTGHTSHQVKSCDAWMAKRSTHTAKKWLELCCLTVW